MKTNWQTLSLITVPFIVGFIMDRLVVSDVSWMKSLGLRLHFIMPLIFMIFWMWVGAKFSKLDIKKLHSFLFGNSLNIIACILFVLFNYVGATGGFLYSFATLYAWPVYNFSVQVTALFTNQIDIRAVFIMSYLLLTVAFTVGFFYRPAKDSGRSFFDPRRWWQSWKKNKDRVAEYMPDDDGFKPRRKK